VTQVGQERSAGNDYAADRLWIETHYPDPRPFGERVAANRRRGYAQAIAVCGALAVAVFVLVPMVASGPVHGRGWTVVSGLVLQLVGAVLFIRALKRRGRRRPQQAWYFCALTARQRRHVLNQARGLAPVAADGLLFVRRLARRAVVEKARGLEMGVGVSIVVIGEGVGAAGTWRWFLLTLAALYVAALVNARRRMHEMQNFLVLHPED
jgi:hypothetical protein